MTRLVYSPAARDDLAAIVAFIAKDKPGAARKLVNDLRAGCELLAKNPEMGERRPDIGIAGCRCFAVGSYAVFYRAGADAIEVARIVHGSRDLRHL